MTQAQPPQRSSFGLTRLARSAVAWLFSAEGSMKERALRGTIWLLIAEAITRLAGVVKLAVLGRLLSPRDFGVLGIALLVQQWIGSFTQTGLSSALIQKNSDIRGYLNTAWTIGWIRGSTVFALIWWLAPPAAAYFRTPESVGVIRLTALCLLLWELANPGVVYLRRELDFRRDVAWRISGAVPGLVAGVVLGVLLRNVWALAVSLVASRVAEVIASYRVHPYRPRPELEGNRARELMHTSKWFSWMNIAGFLEYQLDSLITARWLGARSLGYYQVAAQLALLPTAGLGGQVAAVLFPAFARIDEGSRRRGFLSALSAVALVLLPAACALAFFPRVLVRLALGNQWDAIVAALVWLAAAGTARGLGGVGTALLQATGRLKAAMILQLVRVLLLGALFCVLVPRFGFTGTAASVGVAALLVDAAQLVVAARVLSVRAGEVITALRWGALAGLPFPVFALLSGALDLSGRAVALLLASLVALGVILAVLRARFGLTAAALGVSDPAEVRG